MKPYTFAANGAQYRIDSDGGMSYRPKAGQRWLVWCPAERTPRCLDALRRYAVNCHTRATAELERAERDIDAIDGAVVALHNRPTLPQDARSEAEGYGDMATGEIGPQTGNDAGHSEEGAG